METTKERNVLVLDSGAIIRSGSLVQYKDAELFSVEDVLNEIKDVNARNALASSPIQIQTRNPPPDALKAVTDFSKKTGDFSGLSLTDLKVLALTYALEKEINGIEHIRTEPKIQELSAEKKRETPLDPFKASGTEGGWITPENIKTVNGGKGEVLTSGKNHVGCVTTDFAMQNVLLQMGLNLISVDGMLLKNVKQWILRCYGCNKVCKDTSKSFCPHCGNSTLAKSSVTVDSQGNIRYNSIAPKALSTRGSRYPIPAPKGGRDAEHHVLTEEDFKRVSRLNRTKDHSNDSELDYVFAGSLAHKDDRVVVGYGKKNPNIARKKVGKTNKTKMQQ